MADGEQVSRTIALVVLAVAAALFVGWLVWLAVSDWLAARAAARHWVTRGQHQLRRSLELARENAAQREALLELGFTERELRMNHSVVHDSETGFPITVYHISSDRIGAHAAAVMRRRAQMLADSLGLGAACAA
ncbi:Uncharacterised protein [Mycobacteroides abscessus subsp. massiliense]|uniref:hypothetical protein n=1 Tax=Mycobacteroides abscessus TaxID=36809 RepID=UPI0009A86569|nr:hypothetical protein [Mycobacteroides abscessus]SKL10400.1 Uncharacterised protein [Mycobacteroides abscessus subsp. massiliense]